MYRHMRTEIFQHRVTIRKVGSGEYFVKVVGPRNFLRAVVILKSAEKYPRLAALIAGLSAINASLENDSSASARNRDAVNALRLIAADRYRWVTQRGLSI